MLTIKNLKAGYDGKAVVEIAELSLSAGEHCLILGKSGSGKTTLLYALAGILKPLAGDITLGTQAITALSSSALDSFRGKNIGIIYQTLHMAAALSVLENILLVQYAAGVPQDMAKAEKLLASLGLLDHRHKKPEELSVGQQQRVAIARAAINNPTLILGDEPTSALDDESCDAVMKLLLDTAKASGASLVIATHDARIKKHFTKTITIGGAA
ncbi:MAG: ABC transporter ATP-binding protein [Rickettsiales bacterium]